MAGSKFRESQGDGKSQGRKASRPELEPQIHAYGLCSLQQFQHSLELPLPHPYNGRVVTRTVAVVLPPGLEGCQSRSAGWLSSSAWKDGCGREQSPLVTATHSCAGCLLTGAVPLALPSSHHHQHPSCVRTRPSAGRRRLEVPNSQSVPDLKAKTLSKPGEWGFRFITTEAHSLEYASITFCHLPQPSYL